MKNISQLTLEAIQHQNPIVFKELELAISEIYLQTKQEYKEGRRKNEMRLEAILKHHFKGNVTISLGNMAPCMRIHDQYLNSVLVRNDHRKYYAENEKFVSRFIHEYESGRRSGVNIKTAQLSGLFAELPFTIYMPDGQAQPGVIPEKFRMTPSEFTAILLHEMGHFYTYCEFFSRTVTTNQCLAAVSKAMDGSSSPERREVIIGELKEKLDLKELNPVALAAANNHHIIEIAVVTETVYKSRAELGISIYDHSSAEFLADQFATRCGAGRHLLTGLDKLHRYYGDGSEYSSTAGYLIGQTATLVLGALFPPLMVVLIIGAFFESTDTTYDTLEARMRRVKQDMTDRLKNRNLSDEDKKAVLEDIKAIDEIMTKVKDRRSFLAIVVDATIPIYRRYRHTMELQKQLETLAASSLYVRAAELSSL